MDYIIALGGNLGNPRETFSEVIKRLDETIGDVTAQSTWLETKALLSPENSNTPQPNYLNGVIVLRTELKPLQLLHRLLKLEQEFGRDRTTETIRWGPRIIDLDIIAAEDTVVDSEELTLPHPEMHKRQFVLEPMLEVAPEWHHPILDKSVKELSKNLFC